MDNFIEVYKNVFSNEYCEKIIQYFKSAEEGGMTKSRQEQDNVDKLSKDDSAIFLPSLPMQHTQQDLMTEFNYRLWEKCYSEYANKYTILNTCSQHQSYTMKIQKTKPGQGYHLWHCESGNRETSNRVLTWTVYLNDEFEAGETEFLYQQYRYKPQQGDVIIFPAAYTHTHRGNPPIGGDKYIITGWIEF